MGVGEGQGERRVGAACGKVCSLMHRPGSPRTGPSRVSLSAVDRSHESGAQGREARSRLCSYTAHECLLGWNLVCLSVWHHTAAADGRKMWGRGSELGREGLGSLADFGMQRTADAA